VSGSILASAHLSDLITYTLDDYERLAYRLATSNELMNDVRTRLAAARETAPLFDSEAFVRDIERLYWDVASRG
jgi:predicted O-linked N-acetylglucosamine transferase (SPINDLY family)